MLDKITMRVLEAAKDANDAAVIDACRRIINARRVGRKADGNDVAMVLAFA